MDRRRQPTPRAAVLPQTVRSLAPFPREGNAVPLKEAIHLNTAEGDHTLYSERVLIGRGAHCRIIVLDPLVSREHALIRISRSEVVIEDLRSANGVYVNNVRIFEPQALFAGDRILVGTQELAVFEVGGERPPLAANRAPRAAAPAVTPAGQPGAQPGLATERADALDVLGRLADRMLTQGLAADAERVLADHLKRLLQGARSGLPVPPSMCANATRLALALAKGTHNGAWINYTIELHLRAQLPMAEESVTHLKNALVTARNVDHALYGFYVEWIRDSLARLPAEARAVLAELEQLRLG